VEREHRADVRCKGWIEQEDEALHKSMHGDHVLGIPGSAQTIVSARRMRDLKSSVKGH